MTRKPAGGTETGEVVASGQCVYYTVRRSARRRRTIAITLSAADGVVVLAPLRVSKFELAEVVSRRAAWILQRLAEPAPTVAARRFEPGEPLPYLGDELPLTVVAGSRTRPRVILADGAIRVDVDRELTGVDRRTVVEQALRRWYRVMAYAHISASVNRWAPVVGVEPARVFVASQKRRWGSCSSDGTLRFNWRLVMAEPALIDYVVVHELAHLRHANHSPAFWKTVAEAMPAFAGRRRALREHGSRFTLDA